MDYGSSPRLYETRSRSMSSTSPPKLKSSGCAHAHSKRAINQAHTANRQATNHPAETPTTRAAARTLAYDDGAPFQPASHSERRRASYRRCFSRNTSKADPSSEPGCCFTNAIRAAAPQLTRLPPLLSRPLIRIERQQLRRRHHSQRRPTMPRHHDPIPQHEAQQAWR